MRPGIVSIAEHMERGDTVRLMTIKGEVGAIASMLTRSESIIEMKEGEVARPDSVFLPSDVYPRAWKKGNSSAE